MDNVTHTIAGLVLADAVLVLRARVRGAAVSRASGSATVLTSVLANNGPDLDFLYSGITAGKLGYLLHHRGHTHTLVAAVPLALLCWGVVTLVGRLRREPVPRGERALVLGVALVGAVLHVLMDFGNNYGVHPFWPFDDHWYYGDAIFIIEPWLLLITAGMALGAVRSRGGRATLVAIIAGVLGLAWWSDQAGRGLCIVLTLAAVAWTAWSWRASAHRRWWSGGLALLSLGALWIASRQAARAHLNLAASRLDPAAAALDVVSTPAPGNPFCWSMLAVTQSGRDYVVRQALVAAWPGLWPVSGCDVVTTARTAPLRPIGVETEAGSAVVWRDEFRGPVSQLFSALRDHCVGAAFARFARVPFWIADGERIRVVGDLRYDRSAAVSFAEIDLALARECPRRVPPWQPPLRLLRDP